MDIRLFGFTLKQIQDFLFFVAVPATFAFVGVVCFFTFCQKRKKVKIHELKKARKGHGHGIIFGLRRGKEVYSPTNNEGSVGVFSASGTGKTTAIGIPTLRSWTETSFTIDISGDICKNCPSMPNKLVFEPDNSETIPYNIFASIDAMDDVDERNEALEQLAYLIMPESPQMNDNAKYFHSNGRKILTASLIAFYGCGMDFIEICKKIVGSGYKNLFSEIDNTNNYNAIMYINSFQGVSEQNISGCKQSCDDYLKLFATNSKIKKSIRRPSAGEQALAPNKIENHNIFVIVDDPKLELYSPLLNIITSQFMQYISSRKVTDTSKTILLFLDEFASLRIDSTTILEALRKYRKRKCRIMLMTQNLADIDILYGHETTKAIMANLRFKVLLGGLGETESQKFFAELIGYEDSIRTSTTSGSNNSSTTESETRSYKIEPSELDRLGKDTALLIHNEAEGYIKLKKNYYFKK